MRKLLVALCSFGVFVAITLLLPSTVVAFEGVVNDSGVRVRAAPSVSAPVLKRLFEGQAVDVVDTATGSAVRGVNVWYRLPSGGWVHSSLISTAGTSAGAPFAGRWVDVDISSQTASAMQGDRVVYTAPVTTGRPEFPTPIGTFRIIRRVANQTMDSTTIGIPRDSAHGYYLTDVLYTQFFDTEGNALHYNYWMPDSVFGQTPTSHGCVGMRLADARFFWDFASIGVPVRIHQ